MTVVLHKAAPATGTRVSMPGWSITADLTPPELKAARALVILRRWLAAALALVVLLCAAGYLLANLANSQAQAQVDAATDNTVSIQAMIDKHSGATQVKAATAALDAELATLFAQDVDIPTIITHVADAVGKGVQVSSINVSASGSTGTVDTETGATSIGTVTMTGTSRRLIDLADYVDALEGIRGVTDVIPASNNAGGSWSLTLELTPVLTTNRFASAGTTTNATDTTGTTPGTGTTPTTAGGN